MLFEPRNSNSYRHKPQQLPPELNILIRESLQQKYTYFNNKELVVDGAIYPEEIILRVGFKEPQSLKQVNFEFSMDYENSENHKVLEKFHLGADALDSMINEYVEALGDIEMPSSWTEFDFDNQKVFLKFSTLNTAIEKMTLDFLKEKGENLEDIPENSIIH